MVSVVAFVSPLVLVYQEVKKPNDLLSSLERRLVLSQLSDSVSCVIVGHNRGDNSIHRALQHWRDYRERESGNLSASIQFASESLDFFGWLHIIYTRERWRMTGGRLIVIWGYRTNPIKRPLKLCALTSLRS